MLLPQLSSTASVQYAVQRRIGAFISSNILSSGTLIRGQQTRPLKRIWDLFYEGLTQEEEEVLSTFCRLSDALGDGFVFLDPFCNLLSHSESLTAAVWQRSALATITELPIGGQGEIQVHSIANSSTGDQSVWQDIGIVGIGTFCASCHVRSSQVGGGNLILRSGAESPAVGFESDAEWNRVYLSTGMDIQVVPLRLELVIASGCTVEVKGLQLEHQPYPSRYKPTWGNGGVHVDARVVNDRYSVIQHGPDWFDCSIRIEA